MKADMDLLVTDVATGRSVHIEENAKIKNFMEVSTLCDVELDSYAAMAKKDMTDAEVAEIYTKALPRWIGLRDEIDLLRKQYLQDRMMKK